MNAWTIAWWLGLGLIGLELVFVFYPFPFLDNHKRRNAWIFSLWALGTTLMFGRFLWELAAKFLF